jgi:dTMP kinase
MRLVRTKNGKKLVCVTGMDGSGKSTLLSRLGREIPDSRVVSIWDLVRDRAPGEPIPPFTDSRGADAYLASLDPLDRAAFIFGALREAIARGMRSEASTLLIDAYWYKYYSTELGMQGESARARLDALVADFPPVDTLVFLDAEPRVTLARKENYSAYETGFDPEKSREGFLAFQTKSYENLKALMGEAGAIRIDATAPASATLRRVRTLVETA